MVLKDDLDSFYITIKNNLYVLNNNNCELYESYYDDYIFHSIFINNRVYYVLNDDVDLNKAKEEYINNASISLLIASQSEEALSCIGLSKSNNIILKKIKRRVRI